MSRCSTSSGRSLRSTASPAIATAGTWPRGCPLEQTVEIGGVAIALVHDSGPERDRRARLRAHFPGARVVCFGHSHQPVCEDRDGLLLLNPGSPTERRRARWHSYAELTIGPAGGRGAHRPALKRAQRPLAHQPGSLSIECWISASSGSGGGGGAWDCAPAADRDVPDARHDLVAHGQQGAPEDHHPEHRRELLGDDHERVARRRVRLGAAQAREPVGHRHQAADHEQRSSQPETSSSKGAEPPSTQSTKRRPTATAPRPISQQPTRQSGLLVAGPRPMCQTSSAAGETRAARPNGLATRIRGS